MFIQPSITKGSAGRPLIDCFNWLVGGNHGWKAVYLNQLRGNVEWGLISSSWSTLCGLKRGSFYWGETERDRGSQNGYRWRWTWMGHDEDRDRNLGLKLLSVLNLVQIQGMFTLNVKVFPKLHFWKDLCTEDYIVKTIPVHMNPKNSILWIPGQLLAMSLCKEMQCICTHTVHTSFSQISIFVVYTDMITLKVEHRVCFFRPPQRSCWMAKKKKSFGWKQYCVNVPIEIEWLLIVKAFLLCESWNNFIRFLAGDFWNELFLIQLVQWPNMLPMIHIMQIKRI